MVYVALLRGINVGGNRKVEMARLKAVFEAAGMLGVSTYINSGNVLFGAPARKGAALARELESAIEAEFGFPVPVIIRDANQMSALDAELPDDWMDGPRTKCDVMFLAREVDRPDILDSLTIKPEIDEVRYTPGAILWRVDRPKVTRSGLMRIVGSELYLQMTIRNCNTARKLAALVGDAQANS